MKTSFNNAQVSFMRMIAGLLVLCGTTVHTRGADRIDWFTLDAGGGVQFSASYLVNFTVGQNDVGAPASASANYRMVTGFWALEDAGPANGLPVLSIALKESNVVLSWPSPSTGFILQQTDSLDSIPVNWVNTPGLPSDNGFERNMSVPADVVKRFYRLQRN